MIEEWEINYRSLGQLKIKLLSIINGANVNGYLNYMNNIVYVHIY